MELIRIDAENAERVVPLIADFRVTLNGYRGIASQPRTEAAREELREFLDAGFPIYAAEDGGELLGYMVCRIDAPCLWVEHLYVRAAYRRRGAATLLFQKAEEIARNLGEEDDNKLKAGHPLSNQTTGTKETEYAKEETAQCFNSPYRSNRVLFFICSSLSL